MTKYLLASEIATYCTFFPDVTETEIKVAEMLIDSFCGGSLTEKTTTEDVKLNRKNKGKLSQNMVTSIESVTAKYLTPVGITIAAVDKNNIEFSDTGNFEYLNIYPTMSINSFLGYRLHSLAISYKNGLVTIPADLKQITAMITQNIYQVGDFSGAKSKSGLDANVMMFDDSFITSDIRMSLSKYKRD